MSLDKIATASISFVKLFAWLALYALIVVVTHEISIFEQGLGWLHSREASFIIIYSDVAFFIGGCAACFKSVRLVMAAGDDYAKTVNSFKYAGLYVALVFDQFYTTVNGYSFCLFDCTF